MERIMAKKDRVPRLTDEEYEAYLRELLEK